jgi:type VI secretion system protein ImpB
MAKDASVAPKERINIRYKPATGDQKEEVELPFKMVVVGDFTQREDSTPVEERARIEVNKDTFADVMKAQKLELNISVKDRLSDDGGDMSVRLPVSSLRDMEPDQIVREVPQLKKLLELRAALTALKGPLGNVPAFRRAIQNLVDDPTARDRIVSDLTKKPSSGE